MAANAQFEVAEEARIVVEETDIGRARGSDVPGHGGRKESLAVDQREIVDLARLECLEGDAWLDIRRGDFDKLILCDRLEESAHAIARLVSKSVLPAW